MVSRCRLLPLLVLGVLSAAPVRADDGSDRSAGLDACDTDIHRLCQDVFPDEKRVAACLVRRRVELSRACAEILAHPPSDIPEGDD